MAHAEGMTYREASVKARRLSREKDWKVVFYVYRDPGSRFPGRLRVGDGYAVDEGDIDDKDILASSHD